MQTTSTNKPWGGECGWIQLGIEWGMSRVKVGGYKSIQIRCCLEFGGLWNASCSSLELSQAQRHREPLHWSELGLWLKQHKPGNVSDKAKSEVFLIIYLFMKCKQQHWKERDISLTQISCVAKYTAKEALLIILHEIYLGFVYSLIRWVSLCFLSWASAIYFQNKGLLFVFFLFVLLIFCSAFGLCCFTDRKYFPHLGKGNSLWRKFKQSPLGSDLPVQSVISYSWIETSDLFLASNNSAAINTSLFTSHFVVDTYTESVCCSPETGMGDKRKQILTKLQNWLSPVVCDPDKVSLILLSPSKANEGPI